MITRLTGKLDWVGDRSAVVEQTALGLAREVLLPAYFVPVLAARVGETITLHTLEHLESVNQGASFVPRLMGFATPTDRAFFELLITVKGLGPRKGLRALAEPPAVIAGAIAGRDARALQKLPEVGKRMAETIIATLDGKVAAYMDPMSAGTMPRGPRPASVLGLSGPAEDAVAALVALGEPKPSAEERVRRAIEGLADPLGEDGAGEPASLTTQQVLDRVFGTR